ncbi:DUF2889 domain-containing protein [Sphingomonas bacterium]|uniref:DUF2889 domain-containing protein n=1 Tax=Sphingomonas bacterium TaxID=1895847 RepID=UPI001575A993|nr:DUF2889 domain-containing protein [Sphingomonas bacterium]
MTDSRNSDAWRSSASDLAPKPAYRRRILIDPAAGQVTAELEDDYHRMTVTLVHRDGIVVEVASAMKRAPWTLCRGAMARLAETFTHVALSDIARRGEKTQNCTHLHDLALFAAAHAADRAPTAYDIQVTDPVRDAREASLVRNGVPLLHWTIVDDRIAAPPELAGRSLRDLGDWIARQEAAGAEAGRILRWATMIARGRSIDIPAGISATAFPAGTCFNFQPERQHDSIRLPGVDIDFSLPGREPLHDLSSRF